jgi:hypothetical protein
MMKVILFASESSMIFMLVVLHLCGKLNSKLQRKTCC